MAQGSGMVGFRGLRRFGGWSLGSQLSGVGRRVERWRV